MILYGTPIAEEIENEVQRAIASLTTRPPSLVVLLVGENPASLSYVTRKKKACEKVGIRSRIEKLSASISEIELEGHIERLNQDSATDGILLQMPLPSHIDSLKIMEKISPQKDVDGFHPVNLGKLLSGAPDLVPCTPLGIQTLLVRSRIEIQGKHVVIVGRSNIVGKPLAALLLQNTPEANATVTVAHRQTRDLAAITRSADILIAAAGNPRFITADMVRKGAVVIDVGIHRVGDKIVGDVDFENVKSKCAAITPVPKGVGPMTVAMLLKNTLLCFQKNSF